MKRWQNVLSFAGVCCSSLCFLALPLIALWLPARGFGWLHNERLTRAMLLMFLAMTLAATLTAYRVHRKAGPGICAAAGSLALLGTAWGFLSTAAGWAALAALGAALFWDRRLLSGAHRGHEGCVEE